jgi:hypothetical protein
MASWTQLEANLVVTAKDIVGKVQSNNKRAKRHREIDKKQPVLFSVRFLPSDLNRISLY